MRRPSCGVFRARRVTPAASCGQTWQAARAGRHDAPAGRRRKAAGKIPPSEPTVASEVSQSAGPGRAARFGLENPAPVPTGVTVRNSPCARGRPDAAACCSTIPRHVTVCWRMPESQRDGSKLGRERCSLSRARAVRWLPCASSRRCRSGERGAIRSAARRARSARRPTAVSRRRSGDAGAAHPCVGLRARGP